MVDAERRIALVTGATQGLGFALAQGLAWQMAAEGVVYLIGRDSLRVRSAVEAVDRPRGRLRGEVLDVAADGAVEAFADTLRARHGGVDVVFSNAAARLVPDVPSAELVTPLVATNNLATTRLLRAFSPILRPGGRLFVVASEFGSLRRLPEPLRASFDGDVLTLDRLDALMVGWRDAVIAGRAAAQGWPAWINVPSKVGQVAAVRVLARDRRAADARTGTLVAAVCPGLIDTAASRPWFGDLGGAQSPDEAAVALLRIALAPEVDARLHGQLVQFGEIVPWR